MTSLSLFQSHCSPSHLSLLHAFLPIPPSLNTSTSLAPHFLHSLSPDSRCILTFCSPRPVLDDAMGQLFTDAMDCRQLLWCWLSGSFFMLGSPRFSGTQKHVVLELSLVGAMFGFSWANKPIRNFPA
jgi:hypothetical protein